MSMNRNSLISLWAMTLLLTLCANAWGQSSEKFITVDFNTALAHVFDATTNAETGTIRVGASPNALVVSPNGRLGFVSNLNGNYVSVIDFTIGAEIKRIRNLRLGSLAISSDGTTVVGADVDDDGLTVIDANALSVIQTISLNGKLGDDPTINDNEVTSESFVGNKVFLETFFDFGVVDLATGSVTDLGSSPVSSFTIFASNTVAATADGKFVLINRQGALLVLDASTGAVVKSLSLNFIFALSASRSTADPAKIYGYALHAGATNSLAILDLVAGSPTFGNTLGEVSLPASFQVDVNSHLAPNADGTRVFVSADTQATPNVLAVDTSNPVLPTLVGAGFSANGNARNITSAFTLNQPPNTAPVITSVNTSLVKNDGPSTIQIAGSGFAAGVQVRIGSLDPLAASVISATLLQVTIPANSAAQGAPIIVTNPNAGQGVNAADQSGILRNAFIIASAPTFQPANQVAIANFGDSSVSILNVSTNTTLSPAILAPQKPGDIAITPDGARAYVEGFTAPASVEVYNFSTNSFEAIIPLNNSSTGIPGQSKAIALAPRFGTGQLAAYIASSRRVAPGPNGFVLELYVIDANPNSPTFNTVVSTFATNAPNPSANSGGLAVTPDGHFAFIQAFAFDPATSQLNLNNGSLVTLDLSAGTSTLIPLTSLGVSLFQFAPEVTADGKLLLLTNDDGSVSVFDINNPAAPSLFAIVVGTPPAGFSQIFLTPKVVGNRMYAFDQIQNLVAIFNFNPAGNDFAQLGVAAIGGTPTLFGTVHDVTPDGKLMYLPFREEDSVAVVDTSKIIANDPTALLTKIGSGIAPTIAVIRPGTPTPIGANVNIGPIPPVSITFSNITTAGATSVTTTNTNPDPLPAGFSLGTPPIYYEISTTAIFNGNIQVCITYNPAQFAPPESAIRLLHDESGTFVDRTTSLDTVNHIVCGSVTHFSAFTVGSASITFLYNSLLQEIRVGVTNPQLQQTLLKAAQDSNNKFNGHEISDAIEKLQNLEHQVKQAGSAIPAAEATRLISFANALVARLQAGQ
jgi:hypothetical protein